MSNWFNKLYGDLPSKGTTLAAIPGSQFTAPLGAYLVNKAAGNSASLKETYKIFNDQRTEYEKTHPLQNLVSQGVGAMAFAPEELAIGVAGKMGQGGIAGLKFGGFQSLANLGANSAQDNKAPNTSDLVSAGINTAASGLGGAVGAGVAQPITGILGAVGRATGISGLINNSASKIARSAESNVKPIINNLKQYGQKQIQGISDFLGNQDSVSFQDLSEGIHKNLSQAYNKYIRGEVKPLYDSVFQKSSTAGAPAKVRIINADDVNALYAKPELKSELSNLDRGLANDDRLQMLAGQKDAQGNDIEITVPKNSIAYQHLLKSRAKSDLNKLNNQQTALSSDQLARKNALQDIVEHIDNTLDKNLSPNDAASLQIADEKYSNLMKKKNAVFDNLGSNNITEATKNNVSNTIGDEFTPQIHTMELVNKTYKGAGQERPNDAFKVAEDAARMIPGAPEKVSLLKKGLNLVTGDTQKEEIAHYGDFLTDPQGKDLIKQLSGLKTLGEKNNLINKFSTGGVSQAGISATQEQGFKPEPDNSITKIPDDMPTRNASLSPVSNPEGALKWWNDLGEPAIQQEPVNQPAPQGATTWSQYGL